MNSEKRFSATRNVICVSAAFLTTVFVGISDAAPPARHAPPKGLTQVVPIPITDRKQIPLPASPPKGLVNVTPLPVNKKRRVVSSARKANRLIKVTPVPINKANPIPKPPSAPKGLAVVQPIDINKTKPPSPSALPPKVSAEPPLAKAPLPKPVPKPQKSAPPASTPPKIAIKPGPSPKTVKPGPSPKKSVAAPKPTTKPSRKPITPKMPAENAKRPQPAALPPQQTQRPKADPLAAHIKKYERQLAQLLQNFTDRHPDVQATRKILKQLRTKPAPLSGADKKRIRRQIAACWSLAATDDPDRLPTVGLLVTLDPEGRVMEIKDTDPKRIRSDAQYRLVSETAKEAIRNCSPLWLPLSGFQSWRTQLLQLDPNEGVRS